MLTPLLASCQENFIVKISPSSPPVFSFYEDNIIYQERINPCLSVLEFYEMRELSTPSKVWELRASGRECVNVDTLHYGEVPRGFVQIGRPSPLRRGFTYRVEVEDQKLRNGSGQFQLS
jgi:hypothetical protein